MKLKPLPSNQPAVRGGPPLDGDLHRWLSSIQTAIDNAVPPGTIKWAKLAAADIALHFDGTGLGKNPGRWARWAICNGSNGTDDYNGRFFRANTAGSGATGGSDSSSHTHSIAHDHEVFTSSTEDASGTVQTGAGSGVAQNGHAHEIDVPSFTGTSGAASATDNRPAYHELVPLMRLEVG